MGQIGHVRDLVMAAQRGGLLKPADKFGGRDYTAYRDKRADDPYTLVRLTADGEAADHTQRFREVGEWIMEMDAVNAIAGWRITYLPPNQP